ncbi:MAG: fructosamine kinase family protein [Methylococcaceae bacterium]|jgi:fructosamine-3-kinase|nr:fructosamine kinase family protein [Methylococcaceae bacterium]MDD1630715.1 fructosamine kinase family protein [Methylococcaceae bacterium]MDD1637426.1 fructosamine kinase family protein [Methylococcaceae bacterium]MDD1644143.1 fructosamine kinase family protein [Methylococcaceae bacterium]OYV20901.1 MAG: aph [Methylococcaceae bacterium NSM2-1]
MNWQAISEQIESATGQAFKVVSAHSLSGGDINSAFRLQGNDKSYFVKLNRADLVAMFEAEFDGLKDIAKTQAVRVPAPVVYGKTAEHSFLVLENLEFGCSDKASDRLLGRQLALMHQQHQPYFGWHRDNTIGSTLQLNNQSNDWLSFWREQRLGFQLKLAATKGYGGRLQANGERLCSEMAALFDSYLPQPSLLHGDLWAGNAGADKQGYPVIFDPACYYGDREADLAMTELFGGFSQDFYAAYQAAWPLDHGYGIRKTFYNLYHVFNHLNLFGGGYLRQAENMMAMLLSEIH